MSYFLRLIPAWGWFLVGCLLSGVPQFAFAQTAGTNYTMTFDTTCGGTALQACQAMQSAWGAPVYQFPGGDFAAWRAAKSRAHAESLSFGSVAWSTGTVTYSGTVLSAYAMYSFGGQVTISMPYSEGGNVQMTFGTKFTGGASCFEPNGINPTTGKCEALCAPPRVWDSTAQTCKDPCSQFAGNSYGTTNSWANLNVDTMGGTGNTTFCDGQCAVSGGKVECTATTSTGGTGDVVSIGETCIVQGPFVHTGKSCSEAGATAGMTGAEHTSPPWWEAGTEAKKCGESGGYWGSVNGVDTCVRKYPGDGTSTKTETEAPGETKTTTNPDGSTTTTEESTKTTCEGATCTTTKTTTTGGTNPDGTPKTPETSTTTESKPKADFCQENPQVAGCDGTKNDGSFGGSCTGGYTCTGDAVQCAIAEHAYKTRCEDEARRVEEQGVAQSFLDAQGPLEIPQAQVDEAKNVNGDFDIDVLQSFQDAQQTYVDFTSECLPALYFEFKGQRYDFDVGFICGIGDFVRMMMHIMAYMGVLALVSQGSKGK